MTVPVAIGLDDRIVRAVWQVGSRVAAVSGRLPWTAFGRGNGSSPVALCRLVVRRDRPAAKAGRGAARPALVGSREIRSTCGRSSGRLAPEGDPDDDSEVLEHAGGGETRGGCWAGRGADVAFGCLQTACVDTTMKAAACHDEPERGPAGGGVGGLSM